MNGMKLFGESFARRLRFESLEDRRVLAVSLGLGDTLGVSPSLQGSSPDYINVSNQPMAYQSEMTLDVNQTNPLHLAALGHKLAFEAVPLVV
jgi:hypothetical protein